MNEIFKINPDVNDKYNNELLKCYQKKKERFDNWEQYCFNRKTRGTINLEMKRRVYLSALNCGRIKSINELKMNEYKIEWNNEINKYILK